MKGKVAYMNGTNRNGIAFGIHNGLDMIINLLAVLFAYSAVSYFIEPSVKLGNTTILCVFIALLLSTIIYQGFDINRPVGFASYAGSIMPIVKANLVFFAIIFAFIALFADREREFFLFVWACAFLTLSTAFLLIKRRIVVFIAKTIRKNGFRIRKVIIVGDNTATTMDFVKQVTLHSEYAMMIIGYVGDKIDQKVGCEKLGSLAELGTILDNHKPTDVVFPMDAYDKHHIIRLVNMCDDRCIKVYFLPVIYGFFKNGRQIEQLGTLPIINVHSTPLEHHFNAFLKRTVDIVGALALIILTSPIMLCAAIAVKISSPGPIFFKQERVGKMGKNFTMLKFRSMRVNVGSEKTWTTDNDPRKTKVGNFLRKSSIDELPQLFNVLIGSMSLVGPRPEVPYYVDYFKSRIPLYMIKHYVKPGITGLAQIKGLRGDTSIEDRIHCDIEYIEKWTLWQDFKILLQTPLKAFNKHEVYAKRDTEERAPTDEATQLSFEVAEKDVVKDEKMKVLYVASTMSHINNFHTRYIEKLKEDGFSVSVMANGEGADYNIPFEKKLFSSINTACRRDIARIMRNERFDRIILNTSLAAFHVRLAARMKYRPRIINVVHGYLFSENPMYFDEKMKGKMLLLAERFLRRKTDAILTMNEEDLHIATHKKLATGPVIPTFGMGVPTPIYTTEPNAIRSEYSKESEFVLCYAAELSDRKNQRFLIAAMPEILLNIPEARLWLVGDGDIMSELRDMADEECHEYEELTAKLEEELKILLIPKDPNDSRNVIVEIRAGAGGEEAALFAADLFRMYSMFSTKERFKLEPTSVNDTELGGYKEITFNIIGEGA